MTEREHEAPSKRPGDPHRAGTGRPAGAPYGAERRSPGYHVPGGAGSDAGPRRHGLGGDVGFASREGGYAGAGGFGFDEPETVAAPDADRRAGEVSAPAARRRGAFWRRWLGLR